MGGPDASALLLERPGCPGNDVRPHRKPTEWPYAAAIPMLGDHPKEREAGLGRDTGTPGFKQHHSQQPKGRATKPPSMGGRRAECGLLTQRDVVGPQRKTPRGVLQSGCPSTGRPGNRPDALWDSAAVSAGSREEWAPGAGRAGGTC